MIDLAKLAEMIETARVRDDMKVEFIVALSNARQILDEAKFEELVQTIKEQIDQFERELN